MRPAGVYSRILTSKGKYIFENNHSETLNFQIGTENID